MDLSGKDQRALAGFAGLYRAVPVFLFRDHVSPRLTHHQVRAAQ
jgi:hypothetical protein